MWPRSTSTLRDSMGSTVVAWSGEMVDISRFKIPEDNRIQGNWLNAKGYFEQEGISKVPLNKFFAKAETHELGTTAGLQELLAKVRKRYTPGKLRSASGDGGLQFSQPAPRRHLTQMYRGRSVPEH